MFRRLVLCAALLAPAVLGSAATHAAAEELPPTVLNGQFGPVIPLKNAAMMTLETTGYRYRAGQQDSHLTITPVGGGLLYEDTGTRELRSYPADHCEPRPADRGIALWCGIPPRFGVDGTMFLEVWPRLGDDFVDGSALGSRFRLWVLADAGFDVVRGGAGDDFVNGAQDDDRVWGGAGDDWIRTGIGSDVVYGDEGNDKLVGQDGRDELHGGAGDDRLYGSAGADVLLTDDGNDFASCGGGLDAAVVTAGDRTRGCERVSSTGS